MDASFFRCKQLLIIDDCAPVRASIKGMTQQLGFDAIHLARDANEAIAKCYEIPFDFILCDINLGDGKDGYQLFEVLKNDRLLSPLCCFIIISAENQRQIVHGLIELQPDDYLLKPFSAPVLEERIVRAIKSRIGLRKVYYALYEQDYNLALDECDSVIRQENDHSMAARRIKGELLLKLQRYADAETFYQQLTAYKSLNWARLGLSVACFYQDRWEDTELQLADLTQFDDTKVEALDWLARLYIKYGRYEKAFETLQQAVLLSPKNIVRQKALANLASITNDKAACVRICTRLVTEARHSSHDTVDNYLNQARAIIDQSYCVNILERAVMLGHAERLVSALPKRFDVKKHQRETALLKTRIIAARGELPKARKMIREVPLKQDEHTTTDSALDAAKAYFELGDLYASQHYIEQMAAMLKDDDMLTETQRIMKNIEQKRHDELKAKIKQINNEASYAYQQGQYSRAVDLFGETFDHMPTNPTLALNILQAMSKGAVLNEVTSRYCRAAIKLLSQSELNDDNRSRFGKYLTAVLKQHPDLRPRSKETEE
ncbi:MAG: response regulator [Gammaproteobacteria bacterium]|nr:response regulator [Gammaproteobacteria bacterium]MBU1555580.1 response regulator [Gammaproteobacteria bacterium]MBU2069067.1 response regulator [Gammaproteobacteria bacterium]MBU2182678.1 response regulator [Gammaproteobacteria bacterium]